VSVRPIRDKYEQAIRDLKAMQDENAALRRELQYSAGAIGLVRLWLDGSLPSINEAVIREIFKEKEIKS
jgi:hypothetical protein